MKKFLLIFSLIPAYCLGQQQKDFIIKGSLKLLPDGTEITIKNEELSADALAVGTVKGGKFELRGKIAEPNLYYISYAGSPQKLYLFLDDATVDVSGHKDSLAAAKVSGSATNDDFIAFNKTFNPFFQELGPIVQSLNAGQPDPGGAKRKRYEELVAQINTAAEKFVQDHSASPVSPLSIIILNQLAPDITVTERRYNQLKPEVKDGYFGKMLAQTIADGKLGTVGSEAVEFVQNDTAGNAVALSSFRGKYVLLDFWASWCGPCRNENPNVVAAYQKFKAKNFTVLGVSLDRAREPWLKAIKDDKLEWTQVSDLKFWNNEAAAKYKIGQIPQNYLIDPNGIIIAVNLRGPELHQKLAEILH